MDDMVKKATTDLTEEIIQLRAENMVLKTVINLADDDSKALHKEILKTKKGKAFWIFMTVAAVGGTYVATKKVIEHKIKRLRDELRAEESIMEEFESDFDDID